MKLPKEFIAHLAHEVAHGLAAAGMINVTDDINRLSERLRVVIYDEITVEDRINAEVRELLQKYEAEIKAGRLDYRTLFEMTRKRLIAEKGVIL